MRLTIKQLQTLHVGPVDLSVDGGECIVLSGGSGSGKSLLLRSIADLDVHEGAAELDGVRCSDLPAHLWRKSVALLPAESQWWGERVGEHFSSVDEVLLADLGFTPAVMEWEVAHCSTGERQRLSLLRLLENEPKVLLLDEPTASLDAENVSRVEKLIMRLLAERQLAVLWVSHDDKQAGRVATRRFQLHNGLLSEVVL